jgi:hypothetical protein
MQRKIVKTSLLHVSFPMLIPRLRSRRLTTPCQRRCGQPALTRCRPCFTSQSGVERRGRSRWCVQMTR